ncbi:MAG: DUF3034 family protein [Moraxellaceae bacterium]|nr:DUF3034 family protein [Moraxellaceae bacterium]
MTFVLTLLLSSVALAQLPPTGGRLPVTGGVTQLEGAGGGGLVPWALIAGYGTRDEIGGSVFYTAVPIDDFTLASRGVAVGFHDRVELSFAEQRFGLGTTVPGNVIRMDTLGLKVRVAGDAVYDQDHWLPQLAVGLQYKERDADAGVPFLGEHKDSDTDIYVAASKLWLNGPLGRSLFANLTLRATRANQLGILGFGGDKNDRHEVMAEGSLALLLRDDLAAGIEYRQKPDNLSIFREEAFSDVFIAWFPHKRVSVTAAWADLGNIANQTSQKGSYLSIQLNH